MKRLLYSVLLGIIISSCSSSPSANEMLVTGNVKGLKKGTLYLQQSKDSTLVTLDSLAINGDGNFELKTEVESPDLYYLYLAKEDHNDLNDRITFFGEPGTITINTSWNAFDTDAKIEGSESQKRFADYQKTMSEINKRNFALVRESLSPEMQQRPEALDSLQQLSDRNTKRGYLYAINFAINNRDSYVAPYIAVMEVPDANKKFLDSIYRSLTPEVAASKYGKKLKELLQ